jgi:hypothetical protein
MFGVGNGVSNEYIKAVGISAVRFARKSEFVTRTIAGEAVFVPVRGQIGDLDAIYHFNDVGAFIWNLVDGKTSVRDIAQAVREEFDVCPARPYSRPARSRPPSGYWLGFSDSDLN